MPYVHRMSTLTITAKGQITIRKELLARMGVGPGDKLEVTPALGGGFHARPIKRKGKRTIEGLIGILARPGQKPLSIEEMNEVIAESWAARR